MGGLSKVGERLQREIDMLNSLPQTKSLSPVNPGQLRGVSQIFTGLAVEMN
jgi:hypothetical protein